MIRIVIHVWDCPWKFWFQNRQQLLIRYYILKVRFFRINEWNEFLKIRNCINTSFLHTFSIFFKLPIKWIFSRKTLMQSEDTYNKFILCSAEMISDKNIVWIFSGLRHRLTSYVLSFLTLKRKERMNSPVTVTFLES